MGATLTWDGEGGDSLWETAANWAGDELPTSEDDVVISLTAGARVEHGSGFSRIRSLRCTGHFLLSDGTLELTDGVSTVNGTLTLAGGTLEVSGSASSFTAGGTLTHQGTAVYAKDGASIRLPGLSRLSQSVNGSINLEASDPGSLLDLPDVTSAAVPDYYRLDLVATYGGKISLPKLAQVDGALDAYAEADDALVDLRGLTGSLRKTRLGSASIEARSGGTIQIPNVTSLDSVDLVLRGTGQVPTTQITTFTGANLTLDGLTNHFPALTNIDRAGIYLSGGAKATIVGLAQIVAGPSHNFYIEVRSPDSALSLPNLAKVVVEPYYRFNLEVYEGGRISLPKLQTLDGAINAYAEDAGSVVELPGLSGRLVNAKAGGAYIESREGGAILIPNVTALERINLTLRGTGTVPLSQVTAFNKADLHFDGNTNSLPGLTNVDSSNITAERGAKVTLGGVTRMIQPESASMELVARDVGSRLSLPNLTQTSLPDYYHLKLEAQAGGEVSLPKLIDVGGAISAYANGPTSTIDLPSISGVFSNPDRGGAYIETRNGGGILIPNVTGLQNINLTLRGATRTPTAQLVSFHDAVLQLDNMTGNFPALSSFQAADITLEGQAELTLASVTELVNTNSASITIKASEASVLNLPKVARTSIREYYQLELFAYSGSRISLPALSTVEGALDVYAEGNGSLVDLPGLRGTLANGPRGGAYLEARTGGTVLIPNVTGIHNYNVTVRNTGRMSTTQLTSLTASEVLVDGTQLTFAALSDTTGTTFKYENGGTAVFQPPTDLTITDLRAPTTVVANEPVEVSWQITNQGTSVTNAAWSDALFLSTDAKIGDDLLLGLVAASGDLPSGGSLRLTNRLIFSPSMAGTRWLVAAANQSHTVFEGTNYFNNTNITSSAIQIQAPDLVVDSVTVQPASAQVGTPVSVTWKVRNAGTASARGPWVDHLDLATGPGMNGESFSLGHTNATEDLAPGASYTKTVSVKLPLLSPLPTGPFVVKVVADATDTVAESNDLNVNSSTGLTLTLPPLPDLAIAQIVSPSVLQPGQTATFSWSITNRGTAKASGPWKESLYLATIAQIGIRVPIAILSFTNEVAAGAALVRTQQIVLPWEITAGAMPLTLLVDSDHVIAELDESNNAGSASPSPSVPAVLALQLSTSTVSETAVDTDWVALVTRNGDPTSALTVNLTSGDPASLTVPATVTFKSGENSATFKLAAKHDGIPTADKSITVTAAATGYQAASALVTVENVDHPQLTLQVSSPALLEGSSLTATLSHNGADKPAVSAKLTSTSNGRLTLPDTVSIPAGQSSATFEVLGTENTLVEPRRTYVIQASAPDFTSTSIPLDVLDDDLLVFGLSLAASTVSEGAGVEATTATVSRGSVSPRSLTVEVQSSNPGVASVPATVTIPGGQASVSFPIAVLNNTQVDGPKTTVLRAFALATISGERLAESDPVTLTVTDDDGPSLFVTLERDVVAEGLAVATTLTVSRNASTNQPLVVSVVSSLPSEATVPPNLTIPAGQASATVPVSTKEDQTVDGNKRVQFTATATGFTPGVASLVVTDVKLPDLMVSEVTAPDSAETEGFVNIAYRVRNQGLASAGTNWVTRIFLSSDPAVGNDVFLAEYVFNGNLPVGQAFGQSRQVRLPQVAGDYWIVVQTDADGRIDEILEDNNFMVLARPLRVTAAYMAQVETDLTAAVAGTPVPLRGVATRTSTGGPAPFVLVNISLQLRGMTRVISALTDEVGRFAVTFTPLPGEAGFYEIGAAHPGMASAPIQDSFTLHGLKAEPVAALKIAEGGTSNLKVTIQNLGDRPLSGLQTTVATKPSNLGVTATLPGGSNLPGMGSAELQVSIQGIQPSALPGEVVLEVKSAEGARVEIPISVVVDSMQPRLVVNPVELVAGMKVGGQALVDFTISNQGGAPSEPITVALPQVPWMRVATPNPLPSLAPGETNHILLQLLPAVDLPLGPYTGTLAIQSGSQDLNVPFQFRALSEAKGDLLITTVDEYTFYAEGAPKVAGASITVQDAVTTQVVATGVSDSAGQFLIQQLPEGYYEIHVSADRHSPFRETTLVVAGKQNEFQAFPRRQAVQYIWRVVPTDVQDRTKIVIETVFEAFVPMPVVTVDPPLIDLSEFTADVTQIDLKVENHGLIAAKEATLSFGTHPDWIFELLVEDLGDIPARSSFTVPLLIKKAKAGAAPSKVSLASLSGGGGGCSVSGNCKFVIECGGGKMGGGASIAVINASASGNCGGGGGGYPGGSGGGGGRAGGGGGGNPGSSGDSGGSCDGCAMAMMKAIVECALKFVLNDAIKCGKDTYSCVSKMSDGLSTGGVYKCFKAIVSCAKAAGKKIPLVGGLKYIECAYGILTACDSLGGGGGSGGGGGGSGGGGSDPKASDPASRLVRLKNLDPGSPTWLRYPSFKLMTAADPSRLPSSVQPLVLRMERMLKTYQPIIYLFGDEAWVRGETNDGFDLWTDAFTAATDEAGPDGIKVNAAERATLLASQRPATVSAQLVQDTLDRWNRSVDYWNAGVFNLAQVPAGQSQVFIALDIWKELCDAALEAFAAAEAEGYADPVDALQKFGGEYLDFLSQGDGDGVCAHVRLRLEQEAVVTREGFQAALDIVNNSQSPLTDLSVEVAIRRRNGQDATEFFAIKPPQLTDVTAVDGNGVIALGATGKAVWTIVATTDAVHGSPEEFLVSGLLRYRQDGLQIRVPLAPTSITVHPSPSLAVKYFHQREVFADDPFTVEVEPSVPYSLAVMVENKGHGSARDVRIDSAQPKIVDNEKGLFADFKIIATEVAGQNLQPSLSVEFGEIPPGTNAIGRWLLTSTILGGFIDYSATFEHLDGLGNKKLSLVEGVQIHELIHIVQATGDMKDGRPDFLVNDIADLYDRPDTLHLSDGSTRPVGVVLEGAVDQAPTSGNLQARISAKLPSGFAYLRIPEPGNGKLRLVRVVRSDGFELPFGENVWTTDRTFLGNARRPVVENTLHLFDRDSTGQYTLYYAALPAGDEIPPTSVVTSLPPESYARIPVTWSGQDNAGGSGIQFYDVYVSIDGGPFTEWQTETLDRSAIYLGALGKTYAFFTVATDNAGNREAQPAMADASTKVTRINKAPVLEAISDQSIAEGDSFILQPIASDPDGDELVFSLNTNLPPNVVIHPYTGLITWVTGEGNGGTVTEFVLQVLDNGSPRMGAIQKFKVAVDVDNQPPILSAIPNRTINEGYLLSVTNTAIDTDLPKQKLSFSLASGAPLGATIHPTNGIFTWRPTESQGGTTNRVTVIVHDDGNPPLAAEQAFVIVVRDTQSDFRLSLGTTNLLVGQSSSLPLVLAAGADLAQLTFDLSAKDAHLENVELETIGSQIVSAAFEPAGEGIYQVRLDLNPDQAQGGSRTVGHLRFDTKPAGASSVASLLMNDLRGQRQAGEPILNALAIAGRIFLIEVEPLLDIGQSSDRVRLTLFGIPGKQYMLQKCVEGLGSQWTDEELLTLVGASQQIERPLTAQATTYYRLVER